MIVRWLREQDLLPEERAEPLPCHRGLSHQAAFLLGRLLRGPLEWWSEQREKARLGWKFGKRPSLVRTWQQTVVDGETAAAKKAAALEQLELRNAAKREN